MSKPIPSAQQQASIEIQVVNFSTQQQAFIDSANLQDAEIARYQDIDDAFKALFDYYNSAIISQYDNERKAINGSFVISPIIEADIVGVSENPPSGRLVPTPPNTDIVRIDEFDAAGYSGSTLNNELQHISNQEQIEDRLQNGIAGSSPTITGSSQTTSAISALSTSMTVSDATGPMNFSVGDVFVIYALSDAAVVQVDSATSTGANPPYTYTLGITVLVPPQGTIGSGASMLSNFSGFNNTERTNKVASNVNLQPIMDTLIYQLESELNSRKSRISEQLAALNTNEDEDGVTQIATAITNAAASDSFITNYLISTNISNTGLTSLSSERSTRILQLNARMIEILAAYTGQTEDYYEQRYQTANNRANTQRGTLRMLKNAEGVKSTMLNMAAGMTSAIQALEAILP